MRMVWAPVWAGILIALMTQPCWAQRDGLRSQTSIARDAAIALVDEANRVNSVDPTSSVKSANRGARRAAGEWSLTPAVARALRFAQVELNAGNADRALATIQGAQEKASSSYDRLKSYQLLTLVHLHRKDEAAAAAAAEAAADMPALPDAQQKQVYTNAALLALNAGHYDKALRYGQAMQGLGLEDAQSRLIIGRALYFGGDKLGAIAVLRKQIDSDLAAGAKPDRSMIEIVMAAQSQLRNATDAQQTLELLKRYYGDPRNWEQILEMMRQLDMWAAQQATDELRARKMLPGGT